MSYLRNKRILVIAPEEWHHLPVSKHHYARALAATENAVYFLNPPSSRNAVTPVRDQSNLFVVDYKSLRGINFLPKFLRDRINSVLIRRIKVLCGNEFDVVWTFDSFRFQNLLLWKAPVKIYHVVDVHIAPLEHEVSLSADIILTVSQLIHNRFDTFHKFKTKINHGVASYFFHPSSLNGDYFPAIRRRNGLNAGYVGNLENWCIDKGTLLKIVEGNPETDFYFIGPYGENSPLAIALKKLKNCVLLGRVPSQALPDFFQYMDLFLMCYDGADKEVNSNHHKILEFLSTGKPAVINYTDEYKDLRDLVIMADNNSELPALFSSVCKAPARYSTEVLQSKRKRYALANSYESQLQKIDLVIKSFLRP